MFNWIAMFVAALIPMITGTLWYNPKTFGNAWMKSAGLTEEKLKGTNMVLVLGLSYLFSFMLALILNSVVIHQSHVFSVMMGEPGFGDPNSDTGKWLADFMAQYGDRFRTFKHGALHGTIAGIMLVTPIIAITAMFERKNARFILINAGYWILTLALMGGIVCGWK